MIAARMSAAKRLNLCKSGANLLHRRLTPWCMPLHMQFELTNFCNLRCPVCPTGSGAMRRAHRAMDVDVFARVMDEIGPFLLTASLWAWGEPLLHPRLLDILRVARRHEVITLLSTNGQNLDQARIIDTLIEEPPEYLIVALDGLTDETNSAYRVGAKLAPILRGVERLAEIKQALGRKHPVLNMRFIVMKHNQHEISSLDEFAARHGFELLSIRNLFFLELTSDGRTIERLAPGSRKGSLRGDETRSSGPLDKFICMHPFWFPTLLADGSVVLCEHDYDARFAIGRMEEGVSFRDLWFSPQAAAHRRTLRDRRMEVSFCRKCPYADCHSTDFNTAVRSVGKAS